MSNLAIELEVFCDHDPKIQNIYSGKPIFLVDFDGVIHSYKSGWKGAAVIPDDPVEGAIAWLEAIVDEFDVRIFSARCNDTSGIAAMIEWLTKHGINPDKLSKIRFEAGKPSAYLILDDRALCFSGTFHSLTPRNIMSFRPWYYSRREWGR